MLRIGPSGQLPMAPPVPQAAPDPAMSGPNDPSNVGEDQMATGVPTPRQPKSMFQADKIPQNYAGYQGPEKGPFKCANCDFFDPQGSTCHVVSGQIDPEGCCNNFLSKNELPDDDADGDDNESAESPDEEAEEQDELPEKMNDAGPN